MIKQTLTGFMVTNGFDTEYFNKYSEAQAWLRENAFSGIGLIPDYDDSLLRLSASFDDVGDRTLSIGGVKV